MSIFSRTRDIIAANVTDLLDRAEDPSKLIRMIILEMEETLVEVRASAARTIADQKEMRRHLTRLRELTHDWTDKASLALSKGREDLAKAALVEKQKAAQMTEHLEKEIAALDESLNANEEDIAKLQAKLTEARSRQNTLALRMESARHRLRMREMYSGDRVQDAFARFDMIERQVDLAEGQADALRLGDRGNPLEDAFAALSSNDAIEAELAALKARQTSASASDQIPADKGDA